MELSVVFPSFNYMVRLLISKWMSTGYRRDCLVRKHELPDPSNLALIHNLNRCEIVCTLWTWRSQAWIGILCWEFIAQIPWGKKIPKASSYFLHKSEFSKNKNGEWSITLSATFCAYYVEFCCGSWRNGWKGILHENLTVKRAVEGQIATVKKVTKLVLRVSALRLNRSFVWVILQPPEIEMIWLHFQGQERGPRVFLHFPRRSLALYCVPTVSFTDNCLLFV